MLYVRFGDKFFDCGLTFADWLAPVFDKIHPSSLFDFESDNPKINVFLIFR